MPRGEKKTWQSEPKMEKAKTRGGGEVSSLVVTSTSEEGRLDQVIHQGCHRVLVSLFSWPGQLLSLNPCQRPKILARMLFWGILSLTVVILEITAYLIRDCDYWGKQTNA